MNLEQLNKYIAYSDTLVVDAMQKIDINAKGILFVVDEDHKLVGTITDGDIRRWLIKTGELKAEIYHLMNELKKKKIAVMFVSSEMPEVLGVADRILVMCDGRITGEVMPNETSQNEILTLATAFEKKIGERENE